MTVFIENKIELISVMIKEMPTSPIKWVPSIPPELNNVILKALQKDPNKRFANALEFAEALQRFVAPAPTPDPDLLRDAERTAAWIAVASVISGVAFWAVASVSIVTSGKLDASALMVVVMITVLLGIGVAATWYGCCHTWVSLCDFWRRFRKR